MPGSNPGCALAHPKPGCVTCLTDHRGADRLEHRPGGIAEVCVVIDDQHAYSHVRILGHESAHRAVVRDLAFDQAGDMLVAALIDGTVVLWDSATGRRVGDPLEAHDPEASNGVSAVVVSPDGACLLTTGDDGSVLRWDMDPDAWKSTACRLVGRGLRPGERLAYVGDQEASPLCP